MTEENKKPKWVDIVHATEERLREEKTTAQIGLDTAFQRIEEEIKQAKDQARKQHYKNVETALQSISQRVLAAAVYAARLEIIKTSDRRRER